MADYQHYINGEFVDSASGETFAAHNPGTGAKIADVAKGGHKDAVRAIQAARTAFDEGPWPRMTGAERAAKVRLIGELITAHATELAELEARDGGATVRKAGLADIPGAAGTFEFYAHLAETAPEKVELDGSPFPQSTNYVRHEPWGVCAGIVPWNFPLLILSWKLAPAIAAGNTTVIKPASLTSLTGMRLAQLIAEADLPPGVVNIIAGPGGVVGEELASNPMVDKIAFTGSTEVGRRVMQQAAGTIKGVTLELGGKSANIVLDDADLDQAAAAVLFGTFMHNGQACESGTRALVQRSIYDEFVGILADRAAKIVLGDQLDPATDLGPLIDHGQVATAERYCEIGRKEVGEPIVGGSRPTRLPADLDPNAYFLPTIFTDVPNTATIAQEEIFGPVLSVIPFDTDEEAVAIANQTIYGLGGGVQSGDLARAEKVAHALRTGTVWINDYHMLHPGRPFGGYKQSGIGRELGTNGFDAYRQVKHVHVNPETKGRDNHFQYSVLSSKI
jgi:acyl-CoA reductase-like NAD-dependent aldehyde dehydrogenase